MKTSPRSGRRRPFVVLRRTLLPVPEGPTIARHCPVSTLRLTPERTGTSKALYMSLYSIMRDSIQEERREEGVQDQHRDDHDDDRGGGGATDALGSTRGCGTPCSRR